MDSGGVADRIIILGSISDELGGNSWNGFVWLRITFSVKLL